jgi:di/tricarboxylate transporter
MVATEIITNNAAALLLFPIAAQAVHQSGFTSPDAIKAAAVTVAIAASCSFSTPIGYQTNTIVYGPGGYKFGDYLRIGGPLSALYLIVATFLIPKIWPLNL